MPQNPNTESAQPALFTCALAYARRIGASAHDLPYRTQALARGCANAGRCRLHGYAVTPAVQDVGGRKKGLDTQFSRLDRL